MPQRTLEVRRDALLMKVPFRISGYVFERWDVVVAVVREGDHQGRGEASGVYYLGDGQEQMVAAIESCRAAIEDGAGRTELQHLLPPGGARNALDCALWELEAALGGRPAWHIAGIAPPSPLVTTFTLGADDPDTVEKGARAYTNARAIKLKLTGAFEEDVGRVAAVRRARPDVWLGVDANQGYSRDRLDELVAVLVEHRVSLLEQPLKRGAEAELDGYCSPIPIAADESALSLIDLPSLPGRFDVVNIKLDKSGGLTEALQMVDVARRLGLKVMVGNMAGSSLAMAPSFILAQRCDFVDLDGPVFLAEDREAAVTYREDGTIWCGEDVWG